MLSLLIDFPQKLEYGKSHGILITLSYETLFFSSATKDLLSSLKNQKNFSSTNVGGNTLNLALKRMLGHFPKIPPHKRISESPD